MTTTNPNRTLNHHQGNFEQILDQALFIGVIQSSHRSKWLKLAAINSMEACATLLDMREQMRAQFNELSSGNALEHLKRADIGQFNKLWRAVFLADPIPALLRELTPMIEQAAFIGLSAEISRTRLLLLAGKDWESFNTVKTCMQEMRAQLCAQFDAMARDGVLAALKTKNQKHHDLLWRAKYLTQPQ